MQTRAKLGQAIRVIPSGCPSRSGTPTGTSCSPASKSTAAMPARSSAKTSDSSSGGPVPPSLMGPANLSRSGGMRYPQSGPWKLITATERPEDSTCAATAHGSLQPVFAPYQAGLRALCLTSPVTHRDGVSDWCSPEAPTAGSGG